MALSTNTPCAPALPRKLTDSERKQWQERLRVRMSPDAMVRLVDELHEITGSWMLVQAGVEFIRDAWTASRFARMCGAQEVRLWPGPRPDFEMNRGDEYELFEVVEADEPNRRRGDEYRAYIRAGVPAVEHDPAEDWIARADEAPLSLERAALLKSNGNYDPSWGLVIHLNLQEYGIRQTQLEGRMASATQAAKDHFREVWVLWKATAYLTWRNGKPGTERFTRAPDLE